MNSTQHNLSRRARELKGSAAGGALRAFWPVLVAIGISSILHFWLAPLLPEFFPRIILDIGINVILAVSLTMVNGFTGQFSMGHAAFMAVGAYTAATLVYYGSARMIGTEDFANANAQSGVLSTMLQSRGIELTDGTIAADPVGAVLITRDPLNLTPGRRYAVHLMDDENAPPGAFVADRAEYDADARLPLTVPSGAAASWIGQRALLVQTPQFITQGDLIYLLSLFAGGIAAALCGYLVGLPSLRLRGDYLAIVTLGFGEIVRVIIQSQTTDSLYDVERIAETPWYQLPKYMGGPVGFTGLPSYSSLFWVWLFAILTLVVAYRLKESTFGRAFLSIREDEIAAEAMGIKTTRYKVQAFVIAAFFAGIAGGLYAHTIGIQLNAGELAFMKSFDIIIMVVLGGMGSISGAAIAAAILSILPEVLRNPPAMTHPLMLASLGVAALLILLFSRRRIRGVAMLLVAAAGYAAIREFALSKGIVLADYRMILYALALILMMILRPDGLFGVRELWTAWKLQPLNLRALAGGPSGRAAAR